MIIQNYSIKPKQPNLRLKIHQNPSLLRQKFPISDSLNLMTELWMNGKRKVRRRQPSDFRRFQPDSNWCKRFCRPVPNHSDMEPYVCLPGVNPFLRCKVTAFYRTVQIFHSLFFQLFITALILKILYRKEISPAIFAARPVSVI